MPFDSLPQTKPLPSTEAEIIADFKAWVLRQPEDAEWDWMDCSACAVLSYYRQSFGLTPGEARGIYNNRRGANTTIKDAARRAQGSYGVITRSSLLRELAKLKG